ncbi:MAG: hypothetical protein ACR2JW_21085 [Thermomicrobiales bacterium]
MDFDRVQQIADAVLFEGYLLYPYRQTAVKNQQRWTFGGVYPEAYSAAQRGADACTMQTECLVAGNDDATVTVRARFLHLTELTVGENTSPPGPLSTADGEGEQPVEEHDVSGIPRHSTRDTPLHRNGEGQGVRLVDELRVGDRVYRPWQEAVERSVDTADLSLRDLIAAPIRVPIHFPASQETELLRDAADNNVGVLIRTQKAVDGMIAVSAERKDKDICKVTVRVENLTVLAVDGTPSRDDALPHTFISTHAIMGVQGGVFISLLDPPTGMEAIVARCQNVGTWPVMVGEEGDRSMMLSSPIILYDYPQIAPESASNLFDGTEIDEILTLRIMTLTDDERREIQESDPRGHELLARTEAIPPEQFRKMHGVIRTLRTIDEDES